MQPEIIKPSDSLSTAWPVEKSLKLYCYHRCVSWRQAVVYWRWDGANFHWAKDRHVQPLLAVHKARTNSLCVFACMHTCGREKECACVSICGHTQTWGGKRLAFIFHCDTRSKNNNKNATLHLLWETAKERETPTVFLQGLAQYGWK